MNTIHTRPKSLLVKAVGAAVVGISLTAAPAALADNNGPNTGNHVPGSTVGKYPTSAPTQILPPPHVHVLPPNKPQGGWK
jgi:hypothetical protein